MLDKEIREPLFDFLEEFYGKIRIFEEKITGLSRTDALGVIDGQLIGFEIKSNRKEPSKTGGSAHPEALGNYLCI